MNKFIKIGLGCFIFLVLVAVALVIYLMNREIVGTPFGRPYLRLSTNEKALEERLSKECGCQVKLRHTYLKEDSDTLDFEFHVSFSWDIYKSSFDSSTNVCARDSNQLQFLEKTKALQYIAGLLFLKDKSIIISFLHQMGCVNLQNL